LDEGATVIHLWLNTPPEAVVGDLTDEQLTTISDGWNNYDLDA
jgi:hypothetical protein